MKRTHSCGELRASQIGQTISLAGWVDRRRDLGGVIFVDLRDKYGKTQVVFDPSHSGAVHAIADALRNEWVLWVQGVVIARPAGMENSKLDTGAIDVMVDEIRILNKSETPPLSINEYKEVARENDDLRLKYRYLDLRRPWIQRNLLLKSKFLGEVHSFFRRKGFEEVETPVLCKSTPEGARDYLVPSRVNPGRFYALPQSPQQYKQLLMIAGLDRYYQIAKCFRDEDLRADRQPEFTQIDVEMSFVEQDDVLEIFDAFVREVMGKVWDFQAPKNIRRMPYAEAMLKYGSDKPDLRFDLPIQDVTTLVKDVDFAVFRNTVAGGGVVRALCAKNCLDFTRKTIDDLTTFVGRYGAKGLVWMRVKEDGVETQVAKFFKPEQIDSLCHALDGKPGDMLFFIAGSEKMAANAMGQLRLEIGRIKGLLDPSKKEFLWVTDFPLFEYSDSENRWVSCHHPFTSPIASHLEKLAAGEKEGLIAQAYDLVLNGVEIGGGSIRIHDPEMQAVVFRSLGLSEEDAREKFGFFIDAFRYGAPPHGGLAFGLDRILATMENCDSIRDFIAFPKTSSAGSLMDSSPSSVDPGQLADVHITLSLPPS